MSLAEQPARWQLGLVLGAGILAISTGASFVRLAIAAAGTRGLGFSLVLAASRLLLASLILLPTWRRIQLERLDRGALRFAGMAGLCLALHFATWISSLSYTSIAASTTLVTTNPIWVTLFSWLWFKEKPTAQQVAGIALAFVGALIIGFGDASAADAGSNPLWGDFLALMGSVAVSFYLLLGREAQRRGLGIGGYAAMAYSVAALVLLPLPLMFGAGYTGYSPEVYLYLLLMAIFPQLIGHTSFNWALVWISPTLVTLAILFEPVGSSFLGYLIFGEVPTVPVLGGGAVLLAGVVIAVLGARKRDEL